jgi:NDP-sugar pyrophosphorylase family protein
MRVEISRELELLDTGGGLKRAAHLFLDSDQPFFVHNVDVISDVDLGRMMRFQREQNALATLAVQQRASSRQLLFDGEGRLCGRRASGADEIARPADGLHALAFCGIHVISPRIFAEMSEDGTFSIIDAYVRLAAAGETIAAFRADGCYWRDLGKPESLLEAARDVESGLI